MTTGEEAQRATPANVQAAHTAVAAAHAAAVIIDPTNTPQTLGYFETAVNTTARATVRGFSLVIAL